MTRLVLTGLLVAGALAGCGGGDGDDGYPEEARSNFVRSCDAQPNASKDVCECALDELERTVPYKEFKAADDAIREGEQPKKATSDKLTAAVEGCVE
jgi:hypothetical protein